MKIRTRLAIAFLIITVVPISLIYMAVMTLNTYQTKLFSETYGVDGEIDLSAGSSIRIFSHLTETIQLEIDREIGKSADRFLESSFLDALNNRLSSMHSFLIVQDEQGFFYTGNPDVTQILSDDLLNYEDIGHGSVWGNYLDSGAEYLIKHRDFT